MNGLNIVYLLFDCLSIFINDNQHFPWLCHDINNCLSEIFHDRWVYLSMHEWVQYAILELTIIEVHSCLCHTILPIVLIKYLGPGFLQDVHGKEMPIVKTNLDEFIVLNIWQLDEEFKANFCVLLQVVDVWVLFHSVTCLLNQANIFLKNWRNCNSNLLTEVLKTSLILCINKCGILLS